jgi:hypothetical protein
MDLAKADAEPNLVEPKCRKTPAIRARNVVPQAIKDPAICPMNNFEATNSTRKKSILITPAAAGLRKTPRVQKPIIPEQQSPHMMQANLKVKRNIIDNSEAFEKKNQKIKEMRKKFNEYFANLGNATRDTGRTQEPDPTRLPVVEVSPNRPKKYHSHIEKTIHDTKNHRTVKLDIQINRNINIINSNLRRRGRKCRRHMRQPNPAGEDALGKQPMQKLFFFNKIINFYGKLSF